MSVLVLIAHVLAPVFLVLVLVRVEVHVEDEGFS